MVHLKYVELAKINIFGMEGKMCQKIVRNAKSLTVKNYGVRH